VGCAKEVKFSGDHCKPTDNAFIEAFNWRFRAESLTAQWLLSLGNALEKMEDRRRYYQRERRHGAIGQKRPMMLLNRLDGGLPTLLPKRCSK
jgi:transposase InsO family protein